MQIHADSKDKDLINDSIAKSLAKAEFKVKELIERAEVSYTTLLKLVAHHEKKAKKIQISYYFGGPGLLMNGCFLSFFRDDDTAFKSNLTKLLSYKKILA